MEAAAVKEQEGGQGEQVDYEMVIITKDVEVMRRLLWEAVRIKGALDQKDDADKDESVQRKRRKMRKSGFTLRFSP